MDDSCIKLYPYDSTPAVYKEYFYDALDGCTPTHLSVVPKTLLYLVPDVVEQLYICDAKPLTCYHIPVQTRESEAEGFEVKLIICELLSGSVLQVLARVEEVTGGDGV